MKRALSLIMLAGVLFAGPALAADPIVGTWKLNVAKSKFSAGGELTGKDGKERSSRTQYRDGEDMKQSLSAVADTTHPKKINANTWDFELKKEGKAVGHVHRVVSADGKTLTVHSTGVHLSGGTGAETLVFDKQ